MLLISRPDHQECWYHRRIMAVKILMYIWMEKKKTNFSWKPLKLETSWHDKDKIKIAHHIPTLALLKLLLIKDILL